MKEFEAVEREEASRKSKEETRLRPQSEEFLPTGRRAPEQLRLELWRMRGIFSWTCQVAITAVVMRWGAFQPITPPAFDLLTPYGSSEARERLLKVDPDFAVAAFTCTLWSQFQ